MNKETGISVAGIIPARYGSARLPGKPLLMIGGKSMIQRVYEQASKSFQTLFVATDDKRIYDAVKNFGGKAVMTSSRHQSGTDRCAEAAGKIAEDMKADIEIVVNIQGDEPFIRPEQFNLLLSCFDDKTVEIATLVKKVVPGEDIFNPNQPKVVLDLSGNAIYFSRAAIPFIRGSEMNEWTGIHSYFKHLGLYAYRLETLKRITGLPQTALEIAESLEQNRWLENGFRIKTAITEWESNGIDTPEDLKKANLCFD